MLTYCFNYLLLNVISPCIPHPKLRAAYLRLLGASIGTNVRIEKVTFIQIQHPLRHLRCGDNSFIGSGVILDLSERIILDEFAIVSPGCSIITHQDFGDFNGNCMSTVYRTKYRPVHLCRHAVVGADSTILAGSTVGRCSVVGAKSLVNGIIPDNVLVSGTPAIVLKHHGDRLPQDQ